MMAWKMRKDWENKDASAEEKIFELVASLGSAACVMAALIGIFEEESIYVILTFLAGAVLFGLLLFLGYRFQKAKICSYIGVSIANFLVFPLAFFESGAIESGTPQWFILGIVFSLVLFRGKGRIALLIITVLDYAGTYYVALNYPQYVHPLKSTEAVYLDSSLSVLLVGLMIGILVMFQIHIYEVENAKAKRQKEEIEQLNYAQNTFFSNMSHEIRTPINTIIGLNEMILREDVSDEIAENAMNIQSASRMLLTLINDILDLSKIESGEMRIVPVQYETSQLFSELVNMIWVRAHDKGLKFQVNVSPKLPSMLYGDEVRIKQILVNILTNAVKYTEEGSVTLEVRSEQIETNKVRVHYAVTDTGIGIRKESLPFLFDSFRRVDEEKNRKIEGTGLGLSISKQLVDLMGGQLTVDSIYTKGSTFHLILDQQIVNPEPVGTMDFMVRRRARIRSQYKQSFEASQARLLVVDDNEMNRLVVKKLLRDTSLQIDTAESGAACLELTKQRYYHVILMDHMMPEMDGVETLQRIKNQENGLCKDTPVVALTANAGSESREFYRKKGFQGYLAKPIHGALLEATVVQYLPENLLEYAEETVQLGEGEVLSVYNNKIPVIVTTDCSCDLPYEIRKDQNIHTMPFYIRTREGRFSDGVEIDSESLFAYMENKDSEVTTECASVEEYENFFAERLSEAESVIHITPLMESSESFNRASEAAKVFGNVHVVNSGHASCGLGLMVLIAANLVREGYSVEAICDRMGELQNIVVTSVLLGSVEQMYRNGKYGRIMKNFCAMFQLRPVLHMVKSRPRCRRILTGNFDKALQHYIHREFHNSERVDKRILFIAYAGCSAEEIDRIRDLVEKEVEFQNIVVQKASATVASNVGLGTIGLMYMKAGGDGR